MTNRQTCILEILAREYRVPVAKFAQKLGVSQVTIRKELDTLASKGFLKREHGYAVIEAATNTASRMSVNFEAKSRIARQAASMVKDDETILIESGSCCALLAEELANNRNNVTIISNSVFIANRIRTFPNIKIILLGGEYQHDSEVNIGAITRRCVEVFFCDKFFVGAGGFNQQYGFTGRNHTRSQTIRDMLAQAQNTIVLTESEKFNHSGIQGIIRTEEVSLVITDKDIPPDKEQFLLGKGVQLQKV